MSQETKKDTVDESKENVEKSSPEEKPEITNKIIRSDASYNKGLEAAVEQIRLFEENSKKMIEVIDAVTFSSNLEKLKNYEESTRITLKAMEDSVRFNIMDSETLKHLNEIREIYFELNQEIVDVPNVSIVSQGALINDLAAKMDGAIRAQDVYIETLERELIQKESEIRQLRAIIGEKKKNDNLMV